MTAYTKTEAHLLSRIASLERAVFDKGPRPDRITELLEANNREVERRRAAEQRVSELMEELRVLKDDYVGCGVLARRELQAKVEAQEQQNLVLLRKIGRLKQQVRHSYRGSLFCPPQETI